MFHGRLRKFKKKCFLFQQNLYKIFHYMKKNLLKHNIKNKLLKLLAKKKLSLISLLRSN